MMRILWVWATTLALVVLFSGATPAQERVWGNVGVYGDIVATDCMNCGDDLGITISCQGEGSDALVRVPFAALDRPADPGTLMVVDVDGIDYPFNVAFEEQGLVGYVPVFTLPVNHPLAAALESGLDARFSIGPVSIVLALTNSRETLEIWRAHCAWTQYPDYAGDKNVPPPAPLLAVVQNDVPPAAPAQSESSEARWFIEEFTDADDASNVRLSFGVPQTDAILFATTCNMDDGQSAVDVSLALDFGALQDGDSTEVTISTRGGQFTYPAKVFIDSEESAGVRFSVGSRAPLWRALQSAQNATFAVTGGPSTSSSVPDTEEAVKSFTEACFVPAAKNSSGRPAAGNDDTSDTPAQPKSGKPKSKPDPVADEETGDDTPDEVDRPAGPSKVGKDSGADTGTQQEPDRPKSKPVEADDEADRQDEDKSDDTAEKPAGNAAGAGDGAYACTDGTKVQLTLTGEALAQVATVVIGDAKPAQLKALPSKTTKLFTNGAVTLSMKDDGLTIVQKAGKLQCTAD